MNRCYEHPPIEEALVEVQFTPSSQWDLTIPGRLHEKLKGSYAGQPKQQLVEIPFLALGAIQGATEEQAKALRGGLGKVLLPSEDGRRLVGIAPNVISVHLLRPYTNWETFGKQVEEAFNIYREIASPDGVVRIGLRYVNKIKIPGDQIELKKYFKCASDEIEGIPRETVNFVHRDEYDYKDGVKLILTYSNVREGEKGDSSFILDLDLVIIPDTPLSVDETVAKIHDLRDRERIAFEALITDELRNLFGEIHAK